MHDVIVICLPTFAVLFGILLNRQDAMAIRTEVKSEIGQLRSEMKSENGQLRSEIITLRDNIHRDMIGIHERVATVESKHNS